jgi:hypothetical protein
LPREIPEMSSLTIRAARTVLLFMAGLAGDAAGADCDCTIYPFKPDPPCVRQCSAKVLAGSNYTSLVTVLGLSPEIAQRVSAVPASQKPDDLLEYAKFLPKAQFDTLDTKMRSLSQSEFQQLRKSIERPEIKAPGKSPP